MNTKIRTILIMFLILTAMFLVSSTAFASEKTWVDLPVSVDENGDVNSVHIYGFYTILEEFGEVFIQCNPDTGEEISAFIPNVKIGEKETTVTTQDAPKREEIIDWDHPVEVNPLQVELMAPNIPSGTRPYWEAPGGYQGETITKNEFKWPMTGITFSRLVPGSDPNNWLFVASVKNQNSYSVNANWNTYISGFAEDLDEALNFGFGPVEDIVKTGNVVFGPNETKFVLLNKEIKKEGIASDSLKWSGKTYYPPYSKGAYNTSVWNVADISYPEILKKDGAMGLFSPYKTWDGTPWTPTPQIPMRLAYKVSVCSTDDWCFYIKREFPNCYVNMEGYLKPPKYDSVEWKVSYINLTGETEKQKAITALESIFNKWGIKNVPFNSIWWYSNSGTCISVNGDTGDWRRYQGYNYYYPNGEIDPGWNPCFKIDLSQVEPKPSSQVPSTGDGWLYGNYGPSSYGSTLTAPALVKYGAGYDLNKENVNGMTFTSGVNFCSNSDVRYYSPNWMDILPVYVADPMFIERYNFVSTAGDYGYLTKEIVPGYKIRVSMKYRPTLNVSLRPVEITANVSDYYLKDDSGDGWHKRASSWKWTPETGLQMLSESAPYGNTEGTWSCYYYKPYYNITIKCAQTFSCSNPTEYTIKWLGSSYGSSLRFYWESESLENALRNQAYNHEASIFFNRVVDTGMAESPPVSAGQTINIHSAVTQGTAAFNKDEWSTCGQGWATWESIPVNDKVRNAVANNLNSIINTVLPYINSDKEATLMEGTTFRLMGSFYPGEGGLIGGSKRNMIFRVYNDDPNGLPGMSWYGDDGKKYSDIEVGFPSCSPLAFSSYTSPWASPTEGMIVRPEDEMFTAEVGNDPNRIVDIELGKMFWNGGSFINTPMGARHWKFYCSADGKVYPEPYPN